MDLPISATVLLAGITAALMIVNAQGKFDAKAGSIAGGSLAPAVLNLWIWG